MQRNEPVYGSLTWGPGLVALMGVFLLGGCGSQAKVLQPPSPPEVATRTVTTQPVVLTTEFPGRTSSMARAAP
jgi:hypothetical protein